MESTWTLVAATVGGGGEVTLVNAAVLAATAGGFFALVTALVQTWSNRKIERERIRAETERERMRLEFEHQREQEGRSAEQAERDAQRQHEVEVASAAADRERHDDHVNRMRAAANELIPKMINVVGYFDLAASHAVNQRGWVIVDGPDHASITTGNTALGTLRRASLLHPDEWIRLTLQQLYKRAWPLLKENRLPEQVEFERWSEIVRQACEDMQRLASGVER